MTTDNETGNALVNIVFFGWLWMAKEVGLAVARTSINSIVFSRRSEFPSDIAELFSE